MELSVLLTSGAAAGLGASLPLRIWWRRFAVPEAAAVHGTWSEWQFVLLHAVWGTALGLLFWLSWGLTAIVNVPWWLRGVLYGVLSVLPVVPLLLMAKLLVRWRWSILGGLLLDALATGVLAGLSCAWNWTHAP